MLLVNLQIKVIHIQKTKSQFHSLRLAKVSVIYVAVKHWFKRNYSFASERLISLMMLEKNSILKILCAFLKNIRIKHSEYSKCEELYI